MTVTAKGLPLIFRP